MKNKVTYTYITQEETEVRFMGNLNKSNLSRKRLHQLIAIGIVTLAILIVLIIVTVITSKPSK